MQFSDMNIVKSTESEGNSEAVPSGSVKDIGAIGDFTHHGAANKLCKANNSHNS